jgi:hypothetical protein
MFRCSDLCCLGEAGKSALDLSFKSDSTGLKRVSTRTWADNSDYDAKKLFNKVRIILYRVNSVI